jgi:exosome complex exonuclease DIS3/RRP44
LEGSVYVKVDGVETIVQIRGREHLNRGMQGDVVAVQLLPKSEWKQALSLAVQEEDLDKTVAAEDEEDTEVQEDTVDKMIVEEETPAKDGELKPTGRVVGVIKRNWRPYCGTIDKTSVKGSGNNIDAPQYVFFWSMDRRIPKIRIRTRQATQLLGKRIIVSIDAWDKTSRHPAGHFVRVLGEVGNRATETEVLLLEHDVPFAPFSPKVLSYLPSEGENWLVTDGDLIGREDFRGLEICSIDPPGCTDIDDALHSRKMENGNFEVGVRTFHFV